MAEGKRNGKANYNNYNVRSRTGGRSRLLFLAIIAVLVVAILIVAKNIIDLRIEKANLEQQEQDLQSKKDELTAELQGVDDLDYIEEQARKLLKMIKPGEVLYILNGTDPRPDDANTTGEESVIPVPEGAGTTQPTQTEEGTTETETYAETETEYTEETTEYTEETTGETGESEGSVEGEYTEETYEGETGETYVEEETYEG